MLVLLSVQRASSTLVKRASFTFSQKAQFYFQSKGLGLVSVKRVSSTVLSVKRVKSSSVKVEKVQGSKELVLPSVKRRTSTFNQRA